MEPPQEGSHDSLDRGDSSRSRRSRWQLGAAQRRRTRRDGRSSRSRASTALAGRRGRAQAADELGSTCSTARSLHRIAESAHLSERVVSSLDEKDREMLTDWLAGVASRDYLSPAEYRYHLDAGRGSDRPPRRRRDRRPRRAPRSSARARRCACSSWRPSRARVAIPSWSATRSASATRGGRSQVVEADRRAFLMKHFHSEFATRPLRPRRQHRALGLTACASCVRRRSARSPVRSTNDTLHADRLRRDLAGRSGRWTLRREAGRLTRRGGALSLSNVDPGRSALLLLALASPLLTASLAAATARPARPASAPARRRLAFAHGLGTSASWPR